MSNIMSDADVIRCLEILCQRDDLVLRARQAKRDLLAHLVDGGILPTVQHLGTGELLRFKAVRKRGKYRRWRNEAAARAILLAEGLSLDEIQKPARLKTPAQIEKLVVRELIQELSCFPEGRVIFVLEDSPLEEARFK